MQVGQIPIQILVSLGLLMCAIIAAIMFDLIKGKNDQLREMIIELKARNDESVRREQLLTNRPVHMVRAPADVKPVEREASPAPAPPNHLKRSRVLSAGAQAAIERGMAMAGNRKSPQRNRHHRHLTVAPAVTDNMADDVTADDVSNDMQPQPSADQHPDAIEIPIAPPVKLRIVAAALSGETSGAPPENLAPVERRAPYRGIRLETIVFETVQTEGADQPASLVMHQIAIAGKKNWDDLLSKRASASAAHRSLLNAVFAATNSSEGNPAMQETRCGRGNLVTMSPREPAAKFALPKAV